MGIENRFNLENKNESEEKKKKTLYFSNFALKHLSSMRILREGGVLGRGGEDWRNVSEHCLAEAVGADILAEYLGADRDKVVKAALLHDWYKRREAEAVKKLGGAKGYQKTAEKDERLLRGFGIQKEIIKLAHSNIPESSDPDYLKNRSLEEKIIHYLDMITAGSEFVDFVERTRISEQKPKNIEFSESFREKYRGASLYEVQIEAAKMEEEEFEKLLGLESGKLLEFIKTKLEERIKSQKL